MSDRCTIKWITGPADSQCHSCYHMMGVHDLRGCTLCYIRAMIFAMLQTGNEKPDD